jgi:hypothetical protein
LAFGSLATISLMRWAALSDSVTDCISVVIPDHLRGRRAASFRRARVAALCVSYLGT